MKFATINVRSFNLHTPEIIRTDTDGDGVERATDSTTTTIGDTTIIDPVSV